MRRAMPLDLGRGRNNVSPSRGEGLWAHKRRATFEPLECRTLLSVTLTGSPNWVEQGPGPINGNTHFLPSVILPSGQNNQQAAAVECIAVGPTNPTTPRRRK